MEKDQLVKLLLAKSSARYKKSLEAVDSAFSCLGDSGRQALYFQLGKRFSVGRKEIEKNIESFSHGLKVFLGPGAAILECMIAEDLYGIFSLPWKNSRS